MPPGGLRSCSSRSGRRRGGAVRSQRAVDAETGECVASGASSSAHASRRGENARAPRAAGRDGGSRHALDRDRTGGRRAAAGRRRRASCRRVSRTRRRAASAARRRSPRSSATPSPSDAPASASRREAYVADDAVGDRVARRPVGDHERRPLEAPAPPQRRRHRVRHSPRRPRPGAHRCIAAGSPGRRWRPAYVSAASPRLRLKRT